jgi:3-oxoadipate enol-lactonase
MVSAATGTQTASAAARPAQTIPKQNVDTARLIVIITVILYSIRIIMTDWKWIDAGGTYLRYATRGRGPDWWVLVHEAGGSLETWDALLPYIPGEYSVLRFDMRGAGLSEKIVGSVSLEELAGDLASLLAALAIDRPVNIVAMAFGCSVALRFSSLHPERVKALALLCPAIEPPLMGIDAATRLAHDVEENGLHALSDELIDPHYPRDTEADEAFAVQAKGQFASNDPRSFAAIYRLMCRLDLDHVLDSVTCPCLVVAGAQDVWRTPVALRALAQRLVKGRFALLDAGHYMLFRDPALVARTLAGFQAEIGG